MTHLLARVNGRGWRRLPPVDLEDLILTIRQSAANHHLGFDDWQQVDRMRKRLAKLRRREAAKAAAATAAESAKAK
jgi:hypothetical protein